MPKKSDKDEIQAGADTLLFPGKGGIAIWVRRDEMLPRAAIRFRSGPGQENNSVDFIEIAALLAALQVALGKITISLADQMGIDHHEFAAICDAAMQEMGPKYDAKTETIVGGVNPHARDKED